MAFSLLHRDTKALLFPTVHIHDCKVHSKSKFDHVLYCQPSDHQPLTVRDWRESDRLANTFRKMEKAKGLIIAGQHCYQKKMHGMLPNRDTLVSIAA